MLVLSGHDAPFHASKAVQPKVFTIRASSANSLPDFAEVWRYRELVSTFGMRDLRLRYRQTALGILWVLLQPLVAAALFAFVFGTVAKLDAGGANYYLLSLGGFTLWQSMQSTIGKSGSSLLSNSHMLSKVFFPRLLLPLSGLVSTSVDFAIGLAMFVLVALTRGWTPGWALLTLPLWWLVMQALGLGVGMVVAAWSIKYRDVQHVLPIVMQLLLYGTPVAYSTLAVPAEYRAFIALNPLSAALDGVRWSLLGMPAPTTGAVLYLVAVAVGALALGIVTFTRAEHELTDVI